MKSTRLKITGVLLLAVIMVSGVNAQPGECQGHKHSFSLDLSEEQQEQMKALRIDHYKTMKPLKSKMAELKARERTLLSEETVDMKAVHEVIDDQTELMNKIRKLEVDHKLTTREILTDEQLMKLDQRRKIVKRRNKHRDAADGPRRPGRYQHRNMG